MSTLCCRGDVTDVAQQPSSAEISPGNSQNSLTTATYETTASFTLEGPRECKVLDIYDGDTFTVATHIPGQGNCRVVCRLNGVDTAEMKNSPSESRRDELKQLAYLARNKVAEHLTDLPPDFDPCCQLPRKQLREICGQSHKTVMVHFYDMDKYGRCLVEVPLGDTSLSEILIDSRLALRYTGGTKTDIRSLLA